MEAQARDHPKNLPVVVRESLLHPERQRMGGLQPIAGLIWLQMCMKKVLP